MQPVDVLIHFRQQLDAGSRHVIDTTLRGLPGVVAPWFTPHRKTLVIVYYNPSQISATGLLNSVRRLGFQASLVAI